MFLRVSQNLADVLLSVPTAVARRIGPPPRTFLGEFRVTFDFQTPRVPINQVPVKAIEFVIRHHVEQMFDEFLFLEMPTAVKHQAAPAESREILNLDARSVAQLAGCVAISESFFGIRRLQRLPQRFYTVEKTLVPSLRESTLCLGVISKPYPPRPTETWRHVL